MIYTLDVTTPQNTPWLNAISSRMKVTKGLVYRIEIEFPAGCAGLAHCVILDGGYQAWPSSPGISFHSNNNIIAFDDTYLKTIAPFQFNVITWNLDDTYPHTLQIRIGLVSSEVFMARFLPTYTYKYFLEMLTKLEEEQRLLREEVLKQPFTWIPPPEDEEEEEEEEEEGLDILKLEEES